MPYALDFREDCVLEWTLADEGAAATRVPDYTPTFYVGDAVGDLFDGRGGGTPRAPGEGLSPALADLRTELAGDGRVVRTAVATRRQTFRHGPSPVLRVDVGHVDDVRGVAGRVHRAGRPGAFTCYNVDLSPGFRYCLERGRDPRPSRPPTTMSLSLPAHRLDVEGLAQLTLGGERLGETTGAVLEALRERLHARDPDVLVLSSAELVPTLFAAAERHGVSLQLGRRPGWRRLAAESTYTSYGRVGHSPARYSVPGRAIVDRSNTFFYAETNLEGCLDLVARSGKPLQELAWASIGNVLTAMQVRAAHERGVLVPWRAWRPEFFKPARTLADADRGGLTVAPEPGVYDDVHELDFDSLYPNIIRTRNISPERIRCDCCETADVPGLDYSVCEEPGYLPDVLGPVIDDRAALKAELAAAEDPDRVAALEGKVSALKWILVACFGYQGFSNAKFGRIECHEAINAVARELLLDAKATLEAGGWRLVHGIVDSLWVTPAAADPAPLPDLAAGISADAGIELEYEAAYDWLALVPMRDRPAGALTKYFGRRTGGEYKFRGIECRQRSTPPFVADVQRALVGTFDRTRDPEQVCDRLRRARARLATGGVDPDELTIDVRVSKRADEYSHRTRTVAALERADHLDVPLGPGRTVSYVVRADDRRGIDRVRLAHEPVDTYDAGFYGDLLVRAATSVVSPLGWDEADVRASLAETAETTLGAFG